MKEKKFSRKYKVKLKAVLFTNDPVMGEYVATRALCEILLWKAGPNEVEIRFDPKTREQLQYGAKHGSFLSSHRRSLVFEATEHFDVLRLQELTEKSATITPA